MAMLQECSKNIELIEIKQRKKGSISPEKKGAKAAVCLVDLSKKDDS